MAPIAEPQTEPPGRSEAYSLQPLTQQSGERRGTLLRREGVVGVLRDKGTSERVCAPKERGSKLASAS
jgi:hypothetical protein